MAMSVRFRLRDAAGMLHAPSSQDSKYTRGVVGLMTGSQRYPGAGVLSTSAALRAGAGYVRYVGPEIVAHLLLARHPEVVIGEGRADCWVIGSGMQGLGTGKRADEMRALLDPAALHNGDSDVADLLERLEPSDAVEGDAAPAIRVVDAGALVDFGALAVAARARGVGPETVDRRPDAVSEGAKPNRVSPLTRSPGLSQKSEEEGKEDSAHHSQPSQKAGRISFERQAKQKAQTPVRGSHGVEHASPARLTPAVRREGFSPFPESSNPLIHRLPTERQDRRGDSGTRLSHNGSGMPLDPAAFWKKPERGGTGRIVRDNLHPAPESGRDELSWQHSDLQRELENARRGHSHPLPGVLARNMVGISPTEGRIGSSPRRPESGPRSGLSPAVRTTGFVRHRPRGTGSRKLYVITPHTGELARLMSSLSDHQITREAIESDRRSWAQRAAERLGCIVVLKGAHTFIAAPGRTLLEVVAPTYWLSTAGTGDVLAGTLGTILAQLRGDIADGRVDLQHAVALGVYLHGYAGGIASGVIPLNPPHPLTSEPLGMAGQSDLVGRPLLAMDVTSALPYAIHAVLDAATSMGPAGLPPRR